VSIVAARIVVGMHEAKTQFSKLVREVEAGREVVVQNFGKPVAKLVPYAEPVVDRKPGLLAGKVKIKPGFDDLAAGFEDAFGD
jgi:prevent-host-death family protein